MELYIRIMKYALVHSNWVVDDNRQLPGSYASRAIETSQLWAASELWLEELETRKLWIPAKIFVKIIASVVAQGIALKLYGQLLKTLLITTDSH